MSMLFSITTSRSSDGSFSGVILLLIRGGGKRFNDIVCIPKSISSVDFLVLFYCDFSISFHVIILSGRFKCIPGSLEDDSGSSRRSIFLDVAVNE